MQHTKMTCHSIQPKNETFVKDEFFVFCGKNDKTISKNVLGKYSQKRLDHAKQSTTDALKAAWKRAVQKRAKDTGDLIDIKSLIKLQKLSRTSPQNSLGTVRIEAWNTEHDKEIHKENIYIYIYISRKKTANYLWSKINTII